VGKGDLEERLRKIAIELGVSDRVIFTGFRTDIRELLWMSDCFAFPNKREGLGIAALERMSAGIPVIGHNIGGIRDFVIDGETGVLVDSIDNMDDYGRVIETFLSELDMCGYGKRTAEITKCFSISESNRIMKETYADG
jgi:glycosyltransferase involved in cell wall biosynthesis